MKNIGKELFISILASIGMAMTIFCLAGIVFDIGFGGNFSLENYTFTKMVAGSALVGLGYGVPTIIYRKESLPLPIKIIIHMGIGTAIYLGVAYAVGWIGGSATVGQGILIGAIQLAVAFVIWLAFSSYYRGQAKKMNEKIQEMKK
ncbi:MAG: DUF3021 domain-containing protein [Clostridiales bacterium]|nr:DUF3021 domain-containing protein [Clostridiales bacterium]